MTTDCTEGTEVDDCVGFSRTSSSTDLEDAVDGGEVVVVVDVVDVVDCRAVVDDELEDDTAVRVYGGLVEVESGGAPPTPDGTVARSVTAFAVLHTLGCDVIIHGGLGRFVVVVNAGGTQR